MTSNVKQLNTSVVDFNALETVDAHEVFPEVYTSPGQAKVRRRINRHPDCISSNPHYVPDEVTLRRLLAWWHMPTRPQCFGLHGETGTGKTEMLLFVADRLNEPAYKVSCHSALMPEDLGGSKDLIQNDDGNVITMNNMGQAAKGYANGGLIIFDEIDKINPSTSAAIHGILEGKPWSVEQFGVTLVMHQNTRITATGNTMGEGGHDRYHTSNRLDSAIRARIGWFRTHYPEPSIELEILNKVTPHIPAKLKRDMVKFGNKIRDAVLGQDRQGVDYPLGATFSTRTLVNWATMMMAFGTSAKLSESLSFAFDGSVDPESVDDVKAIVDSVFGTMIDENLATIIKDAKDNAGKK